MKEKTKILCTVLFGCLAVFGMAGEAQAIGEPTTPINLEATALSDTEINLTWERIGADETSITVWRLSGGDYVELAILPARSNIFTDTSLYPATEYNYRITADNGNGSSVPSSSVSATTKASGATAVAATNFMATVNSPYSITLSWNDSNTMSRSWSLERSSDGVSYSVIKTIGSAVASLSYIDTPLMPGTQYHYRIRLITGSNYSDYTTPISATTQSRPQSVPLEPENLSATVNSATETTLTWADTNGGAATYLVETAPFVWTPTLPTWTQITETTAGATNYSLSTVAEKFYYIRIRAKNGSGNSGYSETVKIRSASPGTGSTHTYEIGPGKTYTSLGSFNWSSLGPGDTVNIYPNKDGEGNIIPYFEKPMISVRGTTDAPITIQGISDPDTGQRPIIDGTGAIESNQWNRSYLPIHDVALVLISYRQSQSDSGWSPGYFSLENLEIRNGYGGDNDDLTYTAFDGSTRTYGHGCGIYIEKGDHITFRNNVIHGNNEGIFGAGQGDQRNLDDILVDSNHIYGNGTVNGDRQHNTYLEGINVTYQFNKYGPLRATSNGSGLKDRGAGTIIRYNWIEDGGHLIDLVEAQNYQSAVFVLDSYHKTYVYGNVLYNPAVGATTPIHYGGDGGVTPSYRKGTLYFYNNTFVNYEDQAVHYYVFPFKLSSTGESLDARNNIISFFPVSTSNHPEIRLSAGAAYFGKNWVSDGWYVYGASNHIVGTENFINNAQNNPGFNSLVSKNFNLVSDSQNIDQQDDLVGGVPPLNYQYVVDYSGIERVVNGSSFDLGAFEYGITGSDAIAPDNPIGLSVF